MAPVALAAEMRAAEAASTMAEAVGAMVVTAAAAVSMRMSRNDGVVGRHGTVNLASRIVLPNSWRPLRGVRADHFFAVVNRAQITSSTSVRMRLRVSMAL